MKILVVSLLRLGDIIQQEPLLRGLRQKYPSAQIHLLLNRQFSSIERLLDGSVDKFIPFDRESLQKGLGEAEYNILWSYTQLDALTERLSDENYDQILNFTHNRLSAYLIGSISARSKVGLYQQDGKFHGLESPWLRYFNDRFSGTHRSLFHYVELLSRSFDIPLVGTARATRSKNDKIKLRMVLFQCLTSDRKKNWGLDNFLHLKEMIEKGLIDYKVRILGAPFERDQLVSVFGEANVLICDLEQAQDHLAQAALLVSGDTSIKHLAAQAGVPIVEIALGSSDPSKTGAFSENVEILKSDVACAPCVHSQECSQKSHLCAESISVDQVFAAVWDRLSNEKIKTRSPEREFERTIWKIYLDQGHSDLQPFYLAAAQDLLQVSSEHSYVLLDTLKQKSQTLEDWLQRAKKALPPRDFFLQRRSFQSNDLAELIMLAQEILRSKKDECGYYQTFLESMTTRFSHPLQLHDRVAEALLEVQKLLEIRNNLIRYIEMCSKEGVYYASGIGKLPVSIVEGSFEEIGTSVQRSDESTAVRRRGRETETLG